MEHSAAPDRIALALFNMTRTEALRTSVCIRCKTPVHPESFRDDISRKEYGISAYCQKCQDETYEAFLDAYQDEEDEAFREQFEADFPSDLPILPDEED